MEKGYMVTCIFCFVAFVGFYLAGNNVMAAVCFLCGHLWAISQARGAK